MPSIFFLISGSGHTVNLEKKIYPLPYIRVQLWPHDIYVFVSDSDTYSYLFSLLPLYITKK